MPGGVKVVKEELTLVETETIQQIQYDQLLNTMFGEVRDQRSFGEGK